MVDFMNNSKAAKDMRNDGIAAANFSSLNCIDLSSPDIDTSVSLLKQAPLSLCFYSGFFCVVNHGISQEFMDEVLAQSKKFFDLPLEEKMKLLRNEKHRGYTPCLDEHLDAVNQINGDYKEGYYIGVEVPEDDPESQKPFYGSNVWPAAGTLPGWRETMQKYHQEALEVIKAVSRLIALALDLDVDFFDQPELLGRPIATLRLLHYEGKLSDPSNGIFGAGAHSDYGLITLLATDNVCGLQICKDKDANPQIWEYVPPFKGAFVVNLGDMLERWSNGIFRSTLHRVLGNGQERFSCSSNDTSQMATLIFEDMIGGHHLKAQDLVTPRAQEYARKTHFERKQGRVWKIAWSIEDLRTHGFGQHLMGHDLVIFIKGAITMEPAPASAILAKLEAITHQWEVINERLYHMGVPREQVGYPDICQDEYCSSCELRGENVIPYTHMNVVAVLPSVGVHESSFCDTLDIVRSHEDQTLIVGTQELVDPLDDEIDSPRKNDLCPSGASTYNLTKVPLSSNESIHTLVDPCVKKEKLKSLSEKVVGVIKGLRHKCPVHLGKSNIVADALSRICIGSFAHIKDGKKKLAYEVHQIDRIGVHLVDSVEDRRSSRKTIKTLEDMLRACEIDFKGSWDDHLPLIEFTYNNNYHSSIQMAPFKVVKRFGKKGKLNTRYISPYRILSCLKKVAYEVELPLDLASVYPMFHVSLIKKCIGDLAVVVLIGSLDFQNSLFYEEIPVEILDYHIRRLRNKEVPLVKVLWWN
ncbi:hypothetical protein CQW23_01849 [Capsicum baccatum]|uniref:Fe2OG dioxygenase domain-containing protein n=1 Tax=Capsicum baccatum TaxID=33114 RepID=A0A2G2XPR0_CAPBA|nr:hypothetical protein CQW23_01849 [Capsicum baccatum]